MTAPPEVIENIPNIDHRHGDGRAEILGIAVFDEAGDRSEILEPESPVIVRVSVRALETVARPNVGFMMRNHLGVDFAGSNTSRDAYELPPMKAGDIVTVDFTSACQSCILGTSPSRRPLPTVSLTDYKMCDWIDNAITLQMGHASGPVYGFMHLPCRVEINKRLADTLTPGEAAVD